ncbi:MAG: acyl-CoA dehydrogenase family protein [Hyphomonadaceae bacterium]|nr:acyl-CoA dehydrogenase family protein [Hyphomonadaceae bacterium]
MQSVEVYEQHRESVRRFAEQEVKPFAAIVDRDARFPAESIRAFPKLGLSGLPFPENLGGSAADLMAQVVTVEEVARTCASSAHLLLTPWVALAPLVAAGSDELQRQIVPRVASGQAMASFCLTEPSGGSDLAGIKTAVERTADGWRLNGTKRFISNGGSSDWYAVLARSGERAFGVFMVHRDDPGLSFGAQEKKMGTRGSPLSDVIFDDCVIPHGRVVGDPSEGYSLMNRILTYSRPLVAAQALGIAQGALEEAIAYTSQRSQFNTKISRFQMVRGMVADMTTEVEAARSLLYRAVAIAGDNDDRARGFASMAKLMCSNTAMSVTTNAVQLHGGYGYLEDFPVERMMRDAKITQIWEGTNQIQQLVIAKYAYSATE